MVKQNILADEYLDEHIGRYPKSVVWKSIIGLCICLLLIGVSACSTRSKRTFLLRPEGSVSPEAIELGKQIITQRLDWLEFKSVQVELKGDEIRVTFEAPEAYTDDTLSQIFQVGLVEWVDTGLVPFNGGDAIDRNLIQLTIFQRESPQIARVPRSARAGHQVYLWG